VPTIECGEPLVDLRVACPEVVVKAVPTFARWGVAERLNEAHARLPDGCRIRVSVALRTMEQQARGYWGHYRDLEERHPEWPRSILRREANKFWHPPDTRAVPGHCTGGAVDVTLLAQDGAPLDMTSALFEGASTQATFSLHLTPGARANRELLFRVMTEAGFSNCYDEWWHWSYGDAGWACRLGFPHAVYGMVAEPPEEALRQIEERRLAEARELAEKGSSDPQESSHHPG
jgi:D-alanyl-D-alanine dipeptidase